MNRLTSLICHRFSLSKFFSDKAYLIDKEHKPYQVASQSIHNPNIKAQIYQPQQPTYQSTKLDSGLTIMTQSVTVPSNINMGILVDVGSRDEDAESSGAMLLLKNTYLKTAITTNETINYGVTQMSGGDFEVKYNRQNIFYRTSCLSHDVSDVFSMMADCAFEPRNIVATSVGMYKNEESHKLDAHMGGNQQFADHIFATAYGGETLGNHLMGSRNNVQNLAVEVIQKFQMTHLTPNRVTISATGIENHDEFVQLVSEKMHLTQLNSSSYERKPAQYVGGEVRNYNDSSNIHVAVAFEGASFKNSLALLVANEILGNFRKNGLIQKNILNKHVFINDAQSMVDSYSDSGLFGLKLAGSASHASEIVNVAAQTLKELRNVSEDEVERAKAVLNGRVGRQLINSGKRLQERTRCLYYLGKTYENYNNLVEGVTTADVQNAVTKALSSPLTLVLQGGQVQKVASYDKVSQLFN